MAEPSFSPETAVDIPLERSLYVGKILRAILYGVEICTFFASVYYISNGSSGSNRRKVRKGQRLYIGYGGILLALVTIEVAMDGLWGQYMWIDRRNNPGGPLGYFVASEGSWYIVLGWAAGIMTNILGDALLVYRCFIIWNSRWYIIALPLLTFLASSVLAIITIVETALPNRSVLNGGNPVRLAVTWVSLTVSLNVIVTSMICLRLLQARARTLGVLSPEMSRTYTSVVAVLIESAAPFTVIGISLVVVTAKSSPLTYAFSDIWSLFCSLSPQMIILRVAMGQGWRKETSKELTTTVVFAPTAVRVHEQSRGVHVAIYDTKDNSGPGTPEDVSISSA